MLYESVIKLSVTKDEIENLFNPECNLGIAYSNARCYLQKKNFHCRILYILCMSFFVIATKRNCCIS